MPSPTEHDIALRAHQLWEEAGKPPGRELEFWLQAEQELQGAAERGEPEKGSPDDI